MGEAEVFTVGGICVDSWVRVEGPCGITCDVVGDEAEFRFGGERSTGLHMIVTEEVLDNLVQKGADALHRMRAEVGELERQSRPASGDHQQQVAQELYDHVSDR